jgi:hypothetical protein
VAAVLIKDTGLLSHLLKVIHKAVDGLLRLLPSQTLLLTRNLQHQRAVEQTRPAKLYPDIGKEAVKSTHLNQRPSDTQEAVAETPHRERGMPA